LIDADTPRAEIWVELYSFKDAPQPTFHLLPHRDGKWFDFFQGQFETMWNASTEWKTGFASRDTVVDGEV
jgi:hypothetical protein